MLRNETSFESKESKPEINKISLSPKFEAQLDKVMKIKKSEYDRSVDFGEWQMVAPLSESRILLMDLKLEDILERAKDLADQLAHEEEVEKLRKIAQQYKDLLAVSKEVNKEFIAAAKDGMKQEQGRRLVTQAYFDEMKASDERQARLDHALGTIELASSVIGGYQAELQAEKNKSLRLAQDLAAEKNKSAQLEAELQESRSAKQLLSFTVQALQESFQLNYLFAGTIEDQKQTIEHLEDELMAQEDDAADKLDTMGKRATALKTMLELSMSPARPVSPARTGMFHRSISIQSFGSLDEELEHTSPKAGL